MVKVPEIVKQLNRDQVVIKYGDDYVLLSTANPEDGQVRVPETLAFLCDEDGRVSDWMEVAGGTYMTIPEVLTEISRFGINKRGAF